MGAISRIMCLIENVLCIVHSHNLMDLNERKILADKGLAGVLFAHYNDLIHQNFFFVAMIIISVR